MKPSVHQQASGLWGSLYKASRTWLRVAAVTTLVALVLLAGMPSGPKIYAVLNDSAHALVFGAVALLLVGLLRSTPRRYDTGTLGATFLLTVSIGIGVEFIQGALGRDASLMDVGTDALGAACALGMVGWWWNRERRVWGRFVGLGVAALAGGLALLPIAEAAVAYQRRAAMFPVLAEFDSRRDLYFTSAVDTVIGRGPLPDMWHETGDPTSLRLIVTGSDYPGIATEPARDWRGWSTLKLDITNPGRGTQVLNVRVDDGSQELRYDDRFNRRFNALGATRTVLSIPLSDIEKGPINRTLNLGDIARLIVFLSGPDAKPGTEFYVTRIWLE